MSAIGRKRSFVNRIFDLNLLKILQGALRVIIRANIKGYTLANRSLRQIQINFLANIQGLADQRGTESSNRLHSANQSCLLQEILKVENNCLFLQGLRIDIAAKGHRKT